MDSDKAIFGLSSSSLRCTINYISDRTRGSIVTDKVFAYSDQETIAYFPRLVEGLEEVAAVDVFDILDVSYAEIKTVPSVFAYIGDMSELVWIYSFTESFSASSSSTLETVIRLNSVQDSGVVWELQKGPTSITYIIWNGVSITSTLPDVLINQRLPDISLIFDAARVELGDKERTTFYYYLRHDADMLVFEIERTSPATFMLSLQYIGTRVIAKDVIEAMPEKAGMYDIKRI